MDRVQCGCQAEAGQDYVLHPHDPVPFQFRGPFGVLSYKVITQTLEKQAVFPKKLEIPEKPCRLKGHFFPRIPAKWPGGTVDLFFGRMKPYANA